MLQTLIGSIPSAPNGSGVRAALTNNKLERGRENNTNISLFSPANAHSGLENRSGESRVFWGVVLFQKVGGLKGNKERRVYMFAHLVLI